MLYIVAPGLLVSHEHDSADCTDTGSNDMQFNLQANILLSLVLSG